MKVQEFLEASSEVLSEEKNRTTFYMLIKTMKFFVLNLIRDFLQIFNGGLVCW